MAEIRIEKLHKAFGDFVAVKDSSFTIEDGEFFVMLGPSGCGKTTTLRMIAGLEMPSGGQIHLDGDDVTFKRGVIGSLDLFDWIRQARDGDPQLRRNVQVQLQSEDRLVVVQEWRLINAWPVKYSGPELSASTNDVAIEELVLTCENLDVQ